MNTVQTIVSILGGVQGLFLTILLFQAGKKNNNANRYLAFLLLLISLTLIIAYLHFSKLVLATPHLLGISPYFTLLYGPLLLFYISAFLNINTSLVERKWLHFIPFVVLVAASYQYLAMPTATKISYLTNIFEDRYQPSINPFAMVRIAHLFIYCLLSFYLFRKVIGSRQNNGRNVSSLQLRWAGSILLASVIIWSIYLSTYFYDFNLMNEILPALITLSIFVVGFIGLKTPELFQEGLIRRSGKKYEYSRLSEVEKEQYREELQLLMDDPVVFTNNALSLQDLAAKLKISGQELSQIINEKFGQSFPDLINDIRISEAQRRLRDPANEHLTILAIAYDVGFNSKSAFYSAFKKVTGETPSTFLKRNKTSN